MGWEVLSMLLGFAGAFCFVGGIAWMLGVGALGMVPLVFTGSGIVLLVVGIMSYRPLLARTLALSSRRLETARARHSGPEYEVPLADGVPVRPGSVSDTRTVRTGGLFGGLSLGGFFTLAGVAKFQSDPAFDATYLLILLIDVMVVTMPLVLLRFRPAVLLAVVPTGLSLSLGRKTEILAFGDIEWWRIDSGPDGPLITASTGAGPLGPAYQIALSDERMVELFERRVGRHRLRLRHT